jgi:hypothetical protein
MPLPGIQPKQGHFFVCVKPLKVVDFQSATPFDTVSKVNN